ncbi:E3 SUMO-protein ligase MMS21-like [Zingiber officinale]|uniref:E3 SUMO-protein ligase MMS21-like n=1 Tax=Zingiber officinale TaxID=94328 RepID=UPI001C4C9050|nr:E3 SUMO-protein ligase MMS21-like [Zingiber officinale]
MTSTQNNLLNTKCPLTGKPVTELQNPIHCMDCKHIYEKEPVIHYISTKKPHPRCPVAGCPKILQVGRVVCDALLTIEIDEMRLASATNINSTMVEDFYRS